jgi:ferredoxin
MALLINTDCINCGVCETECPNQAIHPGKGTYVIAPDKCTECVGHYRNSQCAAVCLSDCIVRDPQRWESKEQLMEKFVSISMALA